MQALTSSFYYTAGSSDKVYHLSLQEEVAGWVVNTQYGRRGKALQTGTKTKMALPYEEALVIYEAAIKERISKGYTREESGEIYLNPETAGRVTGLVPMLLNPFVEEVFTAEEALNDEAWMLQEKYDGERQMLAVKNEKDIVLANRKGLEIAIPPSLKEAAIEQFKSSGAFTVDGERMGNALVVFDVLVWNGADVTAEPANYRISLADFEELSYSSELNENSIGLYKVRTIPGHDIEAKKEFFNELKERNAEGGVFKESKAEYQAGRPSRLGSALKEKFVKTASVIVTATHKSKRSVSMGVVAESGEVVEVGNVTIPANKDIPDAGDLVEVRYLYAYEQGSLFQPVYLGKRSDIDREACVIGQLVYKA